MKKKASGMVSPWMQAEELDIGHMGNPGDWMPVGHNGRPESPGGIRGRQTRLNMDILQDIAVVVVMEEPIRKRRPVGKQSYGDQKKGKQPGRSRVLDLRRVYIPRLVSRDSFN